MNFYARAGGRIAGFPFHVDIPSNGVVTMILNVQRAVRFEIANGGEPTAIELPVGALLLLSGESRYVWKHRVLPSAAPPGASGHPVERVSLVLGFQ
jgi:alkylated DNA repair dioxygenase AlkB